MILIRCHFSAVVGVCASKKIKNSCVRADDQLFATVLVEDLVLVLTKDAFLVAHKDKV